MKATNVTSSQIRAISDLVLAVEHLSKTDRTYDTPESRKRRLALYIRRARNTGLTPVQILEVLS